MSEKVNFLMKRRKMIFAVVNMTKLKIFWYFLASFILSNLLLDRLSMVFSDNKGWFSSIQGHIVGLLLNV